MRDYRPSHEQDRRIAFPADLPLPSPPFAFDGSSLQFPRQPTRFEPVGTMRLPDGWVLGVNGFVVDAAGTYLIDTNMWFPRHRQTPVFGLIKRLASSRLEGRSVSFLSLWASDNYCHFLLEAMPRIEVFLAAGHTWDDVDHVLFPSFDGHSASWVLDRLPVPREKIRFVPFGEYVQCEELIATSHPGSPRIVPRWSAEFLRGLAGPQAGSPGRRIYIPRRATRRRLVNEPEIEQMLTDDFGFEILDGTGNSNEIASMHEANIVVGPHGAGLARTAFCRPDARLIELFSPHWVEPYYWSLAVAGGRHYSAVMGTASRRGQSMRAWATGVYTDFRVDLVTLRRAVQAAIA